MATFLLVHCGFAGGWTWSGVADRLRARGHRVFTPTLTGLGERAHLASPAIDLRTHIQDLIGVAECEQLSDVVLVASSSGVMAATGFAGRHPQRVRTVVYVDTLVPEPGQSWVDLLGSSVCQPLLEAARRTGDGWRVPPIDADPPRWVPQPLATIAEPLPAGDPAADAIPRVYIHCTGKPGTWFLGLGAVIEQQARRAKARGWRCHELDTDHLPMLSAPDELALLLQAIATEAEP